MSSTEIKAGKNCKICQKQVDTHSIGFDFTCRNCQHECRRVEPMYRELVAMHVKQQRENALAIKAIKDELAELKNSLSSRQTKASSTLKGLKDTIAEVASEVACLKQIKSKTESDERLKKLEKGMEQLKKDLQSLDQEVATVYAEQQDGAKWSGAIASAEVQEIQEQVDGMKDFQDRLKDAFIDLTGPEQKQVRKDEEQREKDAKELRNGVAEIQGFMKQMQMAFSMLPVVTPPATPQQTPTTTPQTVTGEGPKKA
ncbi:hypothetical protein PSEUBRA_001099 [Kalmanozyma brasiliensis GHG001]|uniref:Uncharacterized protein n=1 Tax=Kalmanozyma brasiliensis (strain GHG001) TaxID=1365824 RepID=V5EF94_KALBG|nr:uncharacterized protein PSEUBRA_001099 [Kalmanozyma brasiliensis GHG001]EST09151.1 hypothetical protein PSEUBRA_001099 [Kalmanozyma brasiliensis GHG001]